MSTERELGYDPKYQCTATSKATGQRCRRAARRGSNVCHVHGGSAPQVVRLAERRLEQAKAEAEVERLELPRRGDVSPTEALAEELSRSLGMVAVLEGLVAKKGEQGLVVEGLFGREASAEYRMLERARQHLVRVSEACERAGLTVKRRALAEQQARVIGRALSTLLEQLGIDDLPPVRGLVRQALEAARAAEVEA